MPNILVNLASAWRPRGQEQPTEKPPHIHNTVHTGIGYSYPHITPSQDDLQRAADILNAGEKVAILVGAGAMDAGDEV